MKKFYLIALFVFSCSKVGFPWDDLNFEEAKILSQSIDKIIMIDFYADW